MSTYVKTITAMALVAALSAMLWPFYRDIVVPAYHYMGFQIASPNPYLRLMSCFIIFCLAAFMPKDIRPVSSLYSVLFFVFILVPILTVPYFIQNKVVSPEYFLYSIFGIVVFFALLVIPSISRNMTVISGISGNTFWPLLWGFTIISTIYMLFAYDFSLQNGLKLESYADLYSIRSEFRTKKSEVGLFAEYGLTVLTKCFIPLLLVRTIGERQYWQVLFLTALQVCLFLISGHKSVFLGFFLVVGVVFIIRTQRTGRYLLSAICGLFAIFLILALHTQYGIFANIIVRRVLVVPGMLTAYYFDFFSSHPFVEYTYSFMGQFSPAIGAVHPAFAIGGNYLGNESASANVNMLMSAYSNLGFWGIAIEGAAFWLTMVLIVTLQKNKDPLLCLSCTLLPLFSLMDSAFPTVLLSHGLAVSIVVLYFLPKVDY